MLSGSVDGRYAENEAAVGLLVGMDTFVDGAAIYRSANNSEGHLMEDLARRGRLRVSAAMAGQRREQPAERLGGSRFYSLLRFNRCGMTSG